MKIDHKTKDGSDCPGVLLQREYFTAHGGVVKQQYVCSACYKEFWVESKKNE